MNRILTSLQFVAASLAALILLSACETTDFGGYGNQREQRAEALGRQGRYDDAAGEYIGLAATAAGPERDRLTLLAVEQWLFAGDGRRAQSALGQVPAPQSGELLWLWNADSAALALWEGRPDHALSLLDPMSRQPLPADHRARVEALRADAWFQKNDPLRAVDLYLQRESWLDDPQDIESSRRRLWAGLLVIDARSLDRAAGLSYDPVASGWLSLAALANSTGQQGIGWGNGVKRWQETYPEHPATRVIDSLALPADTVLNYPRRIALLLPLSGTSATAGNAVKNGFLGAYFASAGSAD
ncbi:MAG: penicillin-binding protein activator, partial [Gammaproteobacteria bacterium]|nr:penicillin-binding protein activator [Gammaproteobacteria bacterium]